MHKKIFVKTYGCQMNEYDSEKIFDLFASKLNFIKTTKIEEADLIILNTCSIREKAQEKLFSDLGRIKKLKKINPKIIIGVGGCVAVQEKNHIFKRAPYVNLVFGPQTFHRLPEMYLEISKTQKNIIDIEVNNSLSQKNKGSIEKFDYFPKPNTKGSTAHIAIMEGCDNFCSYCIVPFTRGREICRPFADIIQEVEILANQNVKEIILLGQNVNNHPDLAKLLYKIAEIKNIELIRFVTSHPAKFTDDLILAFKQIPKLAAHIHLPVQSGSNNILKAMRRNYSIEEYQEKIAKLREARPNINISSDFIVGFPNETEQDFADTVNLVQKINFDTSYSFIYSPRPNTAAAKIKDNVPFSEKQLRLQILQSEIILSAKKVRDNMIGTIQRVLVKEILKPNNSAKNIFYFKGQTDNNHGVLFTATQNLLGKMIQVKITHIDNNTLIGEYL